MLPHLIQLFCQQLPRTLACALTFHSLTSSFYCDTWCNGICLSGYYLQWQENSMASNVSKHSTPLSLKRIQTPILCESFRSYELYWYTVKCRMETNNSGKYHRANKISMGKSEHSSFVKFNGRKRLHRLIVVAFYSWYFNYFPMGSVKNLPGVCVCVRDQHNGMD